MGRRAKPAKVKTEDELAALRKALKDQTARRRQLDKRLQDAQAKITATAEALQTRSRELAQAHEQQGATSQILRVISSAPADLQPILDAIAENAARVCGANDALVFRVDGEVLREVVTYGPLPYSLSVGATIPIDRRTVVGRSVHDRRAIHVEDVMAAEADFPETVSRIRKAGYTTGTNLAMPLLGEGAPLGTILIRRPDVLPFTEQEIALLQTFADQAVIAIENARLLQELRASNRSLTDALERQTATSDILRVISSSPTDITPVLDTILQSGLRLCEAQFGAMFRFDGGAFRLAVATEIAPEFRAYLERARIPPGHETPLRRAALEKRPVQVEDIFGDPAFAPPEIYRQEGMRTALAVPMLKEGELIGALTFHRHEVRPFSASQIALLETFAAQAVIAVENVRLFTELQARNRDLTEALEQQTATAEILRVISSSPTDVQPILEAIVESARRLCDGVYSAVYRVEDDMVHLVAHNHQSPESLRALERAWPFPLQSPESLVCRAVRERAVVHVGDIEHDPTVPESARQRSRAVDVRSLLAVPMLREGVPLGAIRVSRQEPRPFSDTQIALLQTFAEQAVIAIENVRLFHELKEKNRALTEALEQQTATAEILRVISSSPTGVEPTFEVIARAATSRCEADLAGVFRFDGQLIHFVAQHGRTPDEIDAARRAFPQPPAHRSVTGRAILEATVVQIPDISRDPDVEDTLRIFRTVLSVPLLRDGRALGAITVARRTVKPFTATQIALLQTFADQAVIAIENVRLFREIEDKSRQLEVASQHKSEFLASMSHELRTPLNAIIGFSEVLAERMFGEINEKQAEYLQDILASGRHLLSLINDILDLSKVEAGRLELELERFHLPTALGNALTLVRERAGRHGITLGQTVDENVGDVVADERKVKQIVLNLLSNAVKFTPDGGRVSLSATAADGAVTVSVSDTGVGIAPEDQDAIFEEFRQVGRDDARKQEGTGLGLTLTKKFVELHGGRIWVQSQPGQGSTFTFTLPLRT